MSKRALAPREIQFVQLLANGNEYGEIASVLKISLHTVHSTLKTVRLKLDTANSAATVAEAMREGYIK
jgi:DNA-binding CsgD family transcriptional regulator